MRRIRPISHSTVPICGVYAILGPEGVYVGESTDCWNRGTLDLAVRLGLECGIVRELSNSTQGERFRVETEVARLFRARGFPIVSFYAKR